MSKNLIKTFEDKLRDDEHVTGLFMKTCDPAFVEAAGYGGFDFAILDQEHGPVSTENLQNLVRAAEIAGILPIVRVQDSYEVNIAKALDVGALGVQIPQIQNAQEAESVVKAARFHPHGERGVCRFVRAANYSGSDKTDYFESAADNLIIAQVEGQEALNNIDSILQVNGIDVIFIGPYDLSQSLGIPGDVSNPKVVEQIEIIHEKASENDVRVGTFTDTIADLQRWKKVGVQYLAHSVDVGIFLDACSDILGKI